MTTLTLILSLNDPHDAYLTLTDPHEADLSLRFLPINEYTMKFHKMTTLLLNINE